MPVTQSSAPTLFFDGVRVEGVFVEDGAHVHLPEERFEESLEAVKRLREFARRARRLDLFDEALQRLPVLVHQVAQAPLVERVEPFGELRVRSRVAVGRRAVHELDEPPEVEAECERLFELRAEGVEQLFAVERRVKALSERHDRLPVAVAQESAGVLGLRENLRRLTHRAETHKLVLEGLAHLHADGVGRAVEYVPPRLLQTFGVQSAALYEVQQRTRLLVDEREDGEQALEFAVAVERNFDEAQKAEQAREGLEDGEHVFAQLVRREPLRERDERRLQSRRVRLAARPDDERDRLRAPQLALENAAEPRPPAETHRRRFEQGLGEPAR